MRPNYPASTSDLLPSERRFLAAMRDLKFGYFEGLRIERGQLVLEPWPRAVRDVKFGSDRPVAYPEACQLKRQICEFFQLVRSIDSGEIRKLEIRYAVPLLAEIDQGPPREGGGRD